MTTVEIFRGRDDELETRIVTTGANLPHGCLVTTLVRYSTSVSTTSEFIHGYHFDKDEDNFVKIETLLDVATQEGKDTIENIKSFWKELK